MGLITLTALLAAWALAMSGLDAVVLRPIIALGAGLYVLAVLIAPGARKNLVRLVSQHWLAVLALIALASVLAARLPAQGVWPPGNALNGYAAFIGIALVAFGAGAVSMAYGRNQLATALLIASVPLALLTLAAHRADLDAAFGRLASSLSEPALAAGWGLYVVLAIHVAADELRRRRSPSEPELRPLMRRLFAPIAAMLTGFAMMAMSSGAVFLAATAASGLCYAAALWPRMRRARIGAALFPALGLLCLFAAGLAGVSAAFATGVGEETPSIDIQSAAQALVTADPALAALTAAPLLALFITLTFSNDRGRAPSRGGPLLLGVSAYALITAVLAPAAISASVGVLFAAITGLSASYFDLGKRKSGSR